MGWILTSRFTIENDSLLSRIGGGGTGYRNWLQVGSEGIATEEKSLEIVDPGLGEYSLRPIYSLCGYKKIKSGESGPFSSLPGSSKKVDLG